MSRPVPKPSPPLNPSARPPARIVLIGPPAAGKTTVGRMLSEKLDVSMRDTDAMLVAKWGTIGDLFLVYGEDGFRDLERQTVDDAIQELVRRPGVVSLGGGAILHPDTRAQLKHPSVIVVLIDIDAETVATRINNNSRPLLNSESATALDRWRAIVKERTPLYHEVASVTVTASNAPPGAVVSRILEAIASVHTKSYLQDLAREPEQTPRTENQ
ncbi:shikimate kinase [Saxibacter everestensis]|uniref:Shikimate kinase n=1 Tax=Saxibacter everestensis TaxID=2909229 RepID=A0ABY8R060_9MICO|nr:shikimate kinase [Brevibacteriaceae bacterium ZFBP1038]